MPSAPLVTIGLTAAAITAFAANSLLARAAIGGGEIGAEAFTGVRLVAGALALFPFLDRRPGRGDLGPGLALGAYAILFSLAYLDLTAATGALVLFVAVQLTIVAVGAARAETPSVSAIVGMVLALVGLVVLTAPGLRAPPVLAALLMAGAGVAWGAYTLYGRRTGAGAPAAVTARNFVVAGVLAAPLLAFLAATPWTWTRLLLAAVSGAITSGLGYAIWYTVAPRLGLVMVAVVQLATPVATAIGAAGLLGEELTWRVAIAGGLIIAGIGLASVRRRG